MHNFIENKCSLSMFWESKQNVLSLDLKLSMDSSALTKYGIVFQTVCPVTVKDRLPDFISSSWYDEHITWCGQKSVTSLKG